MLMSAFSFSRMIHKENKTHIGFLIKKLKEISPSCYLCDKSDVCLQF